MITVAIFLMLTQTPKALCYDNALYDIINSCIDSKYHKAIPGPESDNFKECVPWKKRSCCTSNVTDELQSTDSFATLYNFNLNHCKEKQEKLSDECHRHFVQDSCFYHCEPNLGPWKVKVKRKFASERFFRVPLCSSDCESWFTACKHDYTCVTNWPREMSFSKGQGNSCPTGAECRTFEEIYMNNASFFCNQVWDESFLVVPDNSLCMRLWFDGSLGNPNEHSALEYAKSVYGQGNSNALSQICLVLLIALSALQSLFL